MSRITPDKERLMELFEYEGPSTNRPHMDDTLLYYDDWFSPDDHNKSPHRISCLERQIFAFGWYCGWSAYLSTGVAIKAIFEDMIYSSIVNGQISETAGHALRFIESVYSRNLKFYKATTRDHPDTDRYNDVLNFENVKTLLRKSIDGNEMPVRHIDVFMALDTALKSVKSVNLKYWTLAMAVQGYTISPKCFPMESRVKHYVQSALHNIVDYSRNTVNPNTIAQFAIKQIQWVMSQCVGEHHANKSGICGSIKSLIIPKTWKSTISGAEYAMYCGATNTLLMATFLIEQISLLKAYGLEYISPKLDYTFESFDAEVGWSLAEFLSSYR